MISQIFKKIWVSIPKMCKKASRIDKQTRFNYNKINMNRKIVSNPKILGGKPVIAGTRISVELIMSLLASGMETKEILTEYPHLKKNDVKAAISFANSRIKREEIHPIIKENGDFVFPTL